MSRTLSIALAQLNLLVGDIEGNAERMLAPWRSSSRRAPTS